MIVHLASCCQTAEPVQSGQGIADVEGRRKKEEVRGKKEEGFSYLGEKSQAIFGKDFSN